GLRQRAELELRQPEPYARVAGVLRDRSLERDPTGVGAAGGVLGGGPDEQRLRRQGIDVVGLVRELGGRHRLAALEQRERVVGLLLGALGLPDRPGADERGEHDGRGREQPPGVGARERRERRAPATRGRRTVAVAERGVRRVELLRWRLGYNG